MNNFLVSIVKPGVNEMNNGPKPFSFESGLVEVLISYAGDDLARTSRA
ncbi:hypothetical protein CSC17_2277 [Klebsiella oxytoca]|nr:hypothetical protein CSC17_2277 [Klebsiella oxytoca]